MEDLSSVMAVNTLGFPVHLATARHAQTAKAMSFFPPSLCLCI